MKSVQERLSAARTALVLDHPFFGALALRLRVVEAPGRTATLGTDGRSLFYNPVYVKTVSDEELVGLWAHEVMHPALNHHTRRGERDPELWNAAADYAENPILIDAGLTLPEGGLIDQRFQGQSAEQIFATLERERMEQQQEEQDGTGAGAADGEGESDDDAEGDGGDGAGQGQGQGNQVPGEVFDAPDPAQDEAEWQVAVKQAAQAAQMMGKLPGSIKLAVEEATKPRLDWRSLLRRFVQEHAKSDYSWKMPNRRYIGAGLYLPQIRSEEMPEIVIAGDTSGSTMPYRAAFLAEMESIVEECQPEATTFLHVDTQVHAADRFERGEPLVIKEWLGNGGTNFNPPFEHIEREQMQPACLIYLTDGYGYFPDKAPEYPVLWVMTTDVQAPWGETVRIAD